MILGGLLLALVLPATAAEPPFFLRETEEQRSVGAVNENDRSLYDGIRRSDLTSGGTVDGNLTISGTNNGIIFSDRTKQTTAAVQISSGTQKWVVFSGTGTVAIQAQVGVTSITDGGAGTYTVNFTANWAHKDSYACSCLAFPGSVTGRNCKINTAPAVGSVQVEVSDTAFSNADADKVHVICIGN